MRAAFPVSLAVVASVVLHAGAAAEPPPPPPALFESLFHEPGAKLAFKVTHTARRHDPDHPDANPEGHVVEIQEAKLECAFSRYAAPKAAWYAVKLTCKGADFNLPYNLFLYTGKGLILAYLDPDDLTPSVDMEALLKGPAHLHPKPKEGQIAKLEDPEGFGMLRTVKKEGAAWCSHHTTWGGDESWDVLCLTPGQGLTSMRSGWAGGSEVETTFTVIPKDQ